MSAHGMSRTWSPQLLLDVVAFDIEEN